MDYDNLLCMWIMSIHDRLEKVSILMLDSLLGDLDITASSQRFKCNQEVSELLSLIVIIYPSWLPGFNA